MLLKEMAERVIVSAQRSRIRRQFRASLGYDGDFENPRSYQEKVQFRKLYGNHAFYALVADKFLVRDYVAARVGTEHLIPLLGAYDRLKPGDFDTLPREFIIKANHGCKWNRVVRDKGALDVAETVRYFNRLRYRRYGWIAGERHYNFIRPKIVIEELLHDEDGGLPWDYSFFCYNGRRGFDYSYALASPSGNAATLTRDGSILRSTLPRDEYERRYRPANFDDLVAAARALCADFDFVRVDLYSVRGKVYFGELTCTPHQGYGPIENETLRRMRDEMWELDVDNPRLYNRAEKRTARPGSNRPAIGVTAR